jgi:hypothetical protein
MKKVVLVFLAVVLLGSCSSKQTIVGTWTDIEGYPWVFSANGILEYDDDEYQYSVFEGEQRTVLTISRVHNSGWSGSSDQEFTVEYSKDGKTIKLTGAKNLSGWSIAGPGWGSNQLTKKEN